MSDQLINACKHGVLGVVVGVGTGVAGDMLNQVVSGAIASIGSDKNGKMKAGFDGKARLVGDALVATVIGAAVLYGGDQLLEYILPVGNDPLYRVIYFNAAWGSMALMRRDIFKLQAALNGLINEVKKSAKGDHCGCADEKNCACK